MINKENCRIVFLGTPTFAATILEKLLVEKYNVVGVITATDKPAGRGMQLKPSAVKEVALTNNIALLQPEKLKNTEFIAQLQALKADIQIVVAFRMLPEIVWHMPPMGTVNLHASLLPAYRGAAPINWAIINGATVTGITTFKLQHAIDTGNVLLTESIDILPTDNAGTLHDKMMHQGAILICTTIDGIINNSIVEKPQPAAIENEPTAPKIFTESCELHFKNSTINLHNLVRGLSPYPTAFIKWMDKKIKVFETTYELDEKIAELIGSYQTDHKTYWKFACKDGWLYLKDIQLEGKKRMDIKTFLLGNKV